MGRFYSPDPGPLPSKIQRICRSRRVERTKVSLDLLLLSHSELQTPVANEELTSEQRMVISSYVEHNRKDPVPVERKRESELEIERKRARKGGEDGEEGWTNLLGLIPAPRV